MNTKDKYRMDYEEIRVIHCFYLTVLFGPYYKYIYGLTSNERVIMNTVYGRLKKYLPVN